MADKFVYINGFSKMFAMTGWGAGYAVGPGIIKNVTKLHENGTDCLPAPGQWVSAGLSSSCNEKIKKLRLSCLRQWDLICSLIDETPGLFIRKPGGDFLLLQMPKSFVMYPG